MFRKLAYIQPMTGFETGIEPYDGDVALMRALDDSSWGPGMQLLPDHGWNGFVNGSFEIYDVPGNHRSIVNNPHDERLAGELRPYLSRLSRR